VLWDSKFYNNIPDNIVDGIYYLDSSNRIDYWEMGEALIDKLLQYKKDCGINKRFSFYIEYIENEDIREKIDNVMLKALSYGKDTTSEIYLFEKDKVRAPILIRVDPLPANNEEITAIIEIFTVKSKKIGLLRFINELIESGNYDNLTYIAKEDFLYNVIDKKIDLYKRFNDNFGYLLLKVFLKDRVTSYYNEILRLVGINILRNIRTRDIAGRLNENNFLCVISNIKEENLFKIEERVRKTLENTDFIVQDIKMNINVSSNVFITKTTDSLLTIKDKIKIGQFS